MPNCHVLQRLIGIQSILNGVHQASASLSSSSRGQERQAFIDQFLAGVLPPIYRFGTGDVTDATGARSGQLDVVVEYPIGPSLPSVGGGANATRLYLAECVAAVVEVKSNIANQWSQAQHTARQLAPIRRRIGGMMVMGDTPTPTIPLFVAGYTGWNNIETVKRKLEENPDIAGILVIDAGLFVSSQQYKGVSVRGPWALWALIVVLHSITNSLQAASTSPVDYAL
ncbi:DUF6602 domain-containing protein [Hyphomonas sp. NPDC076900]|uniref:DUF6602 domain-containing protein n=1 Tax=unclassified Hyphomonas TaxID=2630699 RepID=UPI003D07AF54